MKVKQFNTPNFENNYLAKLKMVEKPYKMKDRIVPLTLPDLKTNNKV